MKKDDASRLLFFALHFPPAAFQSGSRNLQRPLLLLRRHFAKQFFFETIHLLPDRPLHRL